MIWISDLDFVISLICQKEKNDLVLLTRIFNVTSETHKKHVWFINLNQEFLENLKIMQFQIIKQKAWFKITSSNMRFFLFLSNVKFFSKLNFRIYFECNEHTISSSSKLLLWINFIFKIMKNWSAQFHEHSTNTNWVRFHFWNSFLTLLEFIKKKLKNLLFDDIRFWLWSKIIIFIIIKQICNLNWNWKN